jgi:hypothetical protein
MCRLTLKTTLLLTTLLLGACAGTDLKVSTAGQVECAPAEVEIIDEEQVPGTTRWKARCRNKEYRCNLEGAEQRATCKESSAPIPP